MDEMTLLEDFRAAVAPPDELTLTRARARMLGPHRPFPRATRGKLALTGLGGLAAAATAAAVAVALTAPGAGPARTNAAAPVVRELAYRAAAVAAVRPQVPPGQWVYWLEEHYAAGDRAPTPAYEVWTTADATDAAFVS